ncbi:MAG: hypothetical protein BEN18_06735 [Epulopiscium sp. Nuni2H_MBin001]|nr:MAG: hypothetical protein BEN18_06735 [Epulopiscium sp. Nuni2H_MBin001]
MKNRTIKLMTRLLGLALMSFPVMAAEQVELTIIGTADIHGNLTSWSYEDGVDYENAGFARIATFVNETREKNPNTLLVDNGDTIQGTLLVDELFNGEMDKTHPVIEIMNYMQYDAMALGNHEFNYGIDYLNKLQDDAQFPFLSANVFHKETGESLVEPYIVKEFDDVKVGVIGLVIPSIPNWDGTKQGILDYDYTHVGEAARTYVDILLEDEDVDVIIVAAHTGVNGNGSDETSATVIAQMCPEIDILLLGHDHVRVEEEINGVLVVAPSGHRQVAEFNLTLTETADGWEVTNRNATIHEVSEFESDTTAEAIVDYAHQEALEFLSDSIGTASADFQPENEIAHVAQGYLEDTAVVDFINAVQIEFTGADVSGAALFTSTSNLYEGSLNYSDVFKIYKYANTLVSVEVTGKELKDYMEWSAGFYNTYQDGDLTISFDSTIPTFNYDMFQGVDYKIDISKPAGSRITDVIYKGEPLEDDTTLLLAVNDYRYNGIGPNGLNIISAEPTFQSDKALRTYIKEYIEDKGIVNPDVDYNWEVIGTDWDEELRAIAIEEINNGTLSTGISSSGYNNNSQAVSVNDLIKAGLHPVFNKYEIDATKSITDQVEQIDDIVFYYVGDTLYALPLGDDIEGKNLTELLATIK